MEFSDAQLRACYESMVLIRRLELRTIEIFAERMKRGDFPGALHSSEGQEAIAVGVMSQLRRDDYVFSTYRGHGHAIAKGIPLERVTAEIHGRATGASAGFGGSMHLFWKEVNFMGGNGIVGGGIPLGLGTAYAAVKRGTDQVTVVFFGDGGSAQGSLHEALNMAAIKKWPLIFVCENNTAEVERKPGGGQYHAPNMAIVELTDLANIMGMKTQIVDGLDLGAVWTAARDARARAVAGEGPTFLEVRTNTWPGGQWPTMVTGRTEVRHAWTHEVPAQYAVNANWFKRNDPVLSVARELLTLGLVDQAGLEAIDASVKAEMAEAVRFADESPFPPLEDAFTHVWPN
jgi:pyruvate dehydrogenase E1 component alpha subunit